MSDSAPVPGGVLSEPPPSAASALTVASSSARPSRGGVYVPPHRARAAALPSDHNSAEFQRIAWEALRKSLNGIVNKVNAANMPYVLPELFHENLVRGRGLFARAVLKAQSASPVYSSVYAALVAVVNTKLPEVGELIIVRLVLAFRKAFRRSQKLGAVAATTFLACVSVAHSLCPLSAPSPGPPPSVSSR